MPHGSGRGQGKTQRETNRNAEETHGQTGFLSPNAKKALRPEDVCGFPAADFMRWI